MSSYQVTNTMNTEDEILTLKRLIKNFQARLEKLEKPSFWRRLWNKLRGS